MTCPITEGMDDETVIKDEDITMVPNEGNPDDLRPNGSGWNTTTPGNRVVTITVGDKINEGGIVELIEKENVKEYIVELVNPSEVR